MWFKSTHSDYYSNKLTIMTQFNYFGIMECSTLIKGSRLQLDAPLWKDVRGYKLSNKCKC